MEDFRPISKQYGFSALRDIIWDRNSVGINIFHINLNLLQSYDQHASTLLER